MTLDFIDKFTSSGTIVSLNSGQLLLGWGARCYFTDPTSNDEYYFYFNDFFLKKEKPWFQHKFTTILSIEEFADLLNKKKIQTPSQLSWKELGSNFFSTSFHDLVDKYLSSGDLEKGVPYTFQIAKGVMDSNRLTGSLKELTSNALLSNLYLYGSWNASHGILGGTPELLFRKSAETPFKVETLACAGTIKCNVSEKVILSDIKEIREHQIVVNGIKEALQGHGRVSERKMVVAHFPHLSHLFTPIDLEAKNILSFHTLINLLHPTPALGTYPKKNGIDWLEKLQQQVDRMNFGAPVGYVTGEESACYVAIRNMQWKKNQIFLGAGCGVVKESVIEKEWKEILLKLNSIKKMLAL